jgi:bifunctional isochorismate lyase / aryl carrier protein
MLRPPLLRAQPPFEHAALLLVDCQRAFVEPAFRTAAPGGPQALRQALLLRDAFRENGLPLAFSRHAHLLRPPPGGMGTWWHSFLREGDPAAELAGPCAPLPGEAVFRKEHYSAFRETGLASWLASREPRVRVLVLAGFLTHLCVDTTARDAFMSGLDVVVAADACAAWRSRDGRSLHDAALLTLGAGVASVVTTEMLLSSLGDSK